MTQGSCLCGGVAFTVTGPLRPVVACHCTQCRIPLTGNLKNIDEVRREVGMVFQHFNLFPRT
jgi:hypothetical protein